MNTAIGAVVLAAVWAGVLYTPDSAQAISGGSPSSVPWLVKVLGVRTDEGDKICVGTAINEQMIITATHCQASAVIFAEQTATLSSIHDIAGTDISVLVLTASHPLSQYATLAAPQSGQNQFYPPGTVATAYGLDSSNKRLQKGLNLNVLSHEVPDYSTEVFNMNSADGRLELSDSGGPLTIKGLLVGIAHASATNPNDSTPIYIFHGISPALERIAELDYLRKAKRFVAAEL